MAGNCDDLVAKAKDAVELVLRIGYGIAAGRLGPVISYARAGHRVRQRPEPLGTTTTHTVDVGLLRRGCEKEGVQ